MPEDFVLADYWSTFVDGFESQLRPTSARLRLRSSDRDVLRRAVPGRSTEQALATAQVDGDWLVIDLTLEELPVAVQQLAAISSVEVIAPERLRRALATHCEAILRRHRDVTTSGMNETGPADVGSP